MPVKHARARYSFCHCCACQSKPLHPQINALGRALWPCWLHYLHGPTTARKAGFRAIGREATLSSRKCCRGVGLALPFTQVTWQTYVFEGIRSMSSRCRATRGVSMWHRGLGCGLKAWSCRDASFSSTRSTPALRAEALLTVDIQPRQGIGILPCDRITVHGLSQRSAALTQRHGPRIPAWPAPIAPARAT